jgi:glucose/mannose transport system permease protein
MTVNTIDGPRGPRPKKAFSRANIFLYGTLIMVSMYYLLPLYVMIVTSLKGMPEIRMGNVFGPPMEVTFQPWVKAWAEACTGINCDGLSRGFGNSVHPSCCPSRLRRSMVTRCQTGNSKGQRCSLPS